MTSVNVGFINWPGLSIAMIFKYSVLGHVLHCASLQCFPAFLTYLPLAWVMIGIERNRKKSLYDAPPGSFTHPILEVGQGDLA